MRIPKTGTIYALLFSFTLFTGCAPKLYTINPEYAGSSFSPVDIAIVLRDGLQLSYSGNLEPEFGPGNGTVLVRDYFCNELVAKLSSAIRAESVYYDTSIHFYNYRLTQSQPFEVTFFQRLHMKEQSSQGVVMPAKGSRIATSVQNVPYVLIVQDLRIQTKTEFIQRAPMMGANGVMVGGGGTQKRILECRADFVLWDNVQGKAISYGRVRSEEQPFFGIVVKSTWDSLVSGFVQALVAKTPLGSE